MTVIFESKNSTHTVQQLILPLLSHVSDGASFWYIINGDTKVEYSLCRLLGFFAEQQYHAFLVAAGLAGYQTNRTGVKELLIDMRAWKDLIVNIDHGLCASNAEYEMKRVDIDALVHGTKQDDRNRIRVHAIRLGRRDSETYCSNLGRQKSISGKFITTPPTIPSLRSNQRILSRQSQPYIAHITIHNDDVFRGIPRQENLVTAPLPTTTPPKKKRTDSPPVDTTVITPSPAFTVVSPSTILTPPAEQSETSNITADAPLSRVLDMDMELQMPKEKRKLDALFS